MTAQLITATSLARVLAILALAAVSGCAVLPGANPGQMTAPKVVDLANWTPGTANAKAPEAVYQFGQFVGIWEATQSSLQQDGSTWVRDAQASQWRWYWTLDGFGVQDDWISPAPGLDPGPGGRGYGTNIRIYNETARRWESAWVSTRGQEVWKFTASYDPARGRLVMESVDLNPPRRNIFHDISGESFLWTQEWTFDNGKSWVPVARISATRKH